MAIILRRWRLRFPAFPSSCLGFCFLFLAVSSIVSGIFFFTGLTRTTEERIFVILASWNNLNLIIHGHGRLQVSHQPSRPIPAGPPPAHDTNINPQLVGATRFSPQCRAKPDSSGFLLDACCGLMRLKKYDPTFIVEAARVCLVLTSMFVDVALEACRSYRR